MRTVRRHRWLAPGLIPVPCPPNLRTFIVNPIPPETASMSDTPLRQRPAWKALEAHHQKIKDVHLRQMFADDPKRGERFTCEAVGLYLDYSKNRATDETFKLLVQLATECDLRNRIDAMF